MVGYNRRFSKFTHIINENLKGSNRKDLFSNYNINAGKLSTDTWHSEAIYSGGRIIGELCHFIDLLLYIHNSNIIDYNVISLNSLDKESVNINLNFENGSKASINYLTFGNFNTKKENLKIYANNLMIELNDFKKLIIHNGSNNKIYNSFFQDKGQQNCINETINCMVSGKHSPIPFQDILNSTKLSIDISQKKIK